MSSPITPMLYLDEQGQYRLYLSGWKPRQFIASEDSMYRQGKDFPSEMKKAGDPQVINRKGTGREMQLMDSLFLDGELSEYSLSRLKTLSIQFLKIVL